MPKNTNAYASLIKQNYPAAETEYYSKKGRICRMKISDDKYFFGDFINLSNFLILNLHRNLCISAQFSVHFRFMHYFFPKGLKYNDTIKIHFIHS